MQLVRTYEDTRSAVGCGLRALYLASADAGHATHTEGHISTLGAEVERHDDIYTAIGAVLDDPRDYGFLVIDCDGFGGLSEGLKAIRLLFGLEGRVPVILISNDVNEPIFSDDRMAAIRIRSAFALRSAVEHALRDRLAWRAA